jgi:hypothetical protein
VAEAVAEFANRPDSNRPAPVSDRP